MHETATGCKVMTIGGNPEADVRAGQGCYDASARDCDHDAHQSTLVVDSIKWVATCSRRAKSLAIGMILDRAPREIARILMITSCFRDVLRHYLSPSTISATAFQVCSSSSSSGLIMFMSALKAVRLPPGLLTHNGSRHAAEDLGIARFVTGSMLLNLGLLQNCRKLERQ